MKKVVFLFITTLFFACNNNTIEKPEKPDDLLSQDKMVAVLYDMSLLNAAKGSNKRVLEENGLMPKDFIYKKHNIDSVQFARSNNYYAFNLETYESIYKRIQDRLDSDKKKYQKMIDIEKKKKDSIVKAKKRIRDSILKISKKKKDSLNNTLQIDFSKNPLKKSKFPASNISDKLKKQRP